MRFITVVLVLVVAEVSGILTLRAQTLDPAKIEDFKKRFSLADQLEKEGKLVEARTMCDGILAEEPKARGSLFLAGMISLGLEDYSRAIGYLEKFRVLEPNAHEGLILLLQAYQALKLNDKVEPLRQELYRLREAKAKGLADTDSFGREKLHGPDKSMIIMLEYFDYRKSPNRVWELKQFTVGDKPPRNLAVLYEVQGPEENWKLVEYSVQPDGTYRLVEWVKKMPKPDYETAKEKMLAVLKQPPPAPTWRP